MIINQKVKLVVFDLDQTLIYDIDSVMLPCIIHDKCYEANEIDKKEIDGSIHWIEADHLKAVLLKGLSINLLKENLIKVIKPIRNIKTTIDKLHDYGIKCILITAGPIQVAKIVSEYWGIDYYFGSVS
jgi:phosphoserine phosphatase